MAQPTKAQIALLRMLSPSTRERMVDGARQRYEAGLIEIEELETFIQTVAQVNAE